MDWKEKYLLCTLMAATMSLQPLHAQQMQGQVGTVRCDTWECLERNTNKVATINGVFRAYTPYPAGKGANHMFWEWEVVLSDTAVVPVTCVNDTMDCLRFEGKNVRIVGTVYFGIIVGDPKGQHLTGFRIDPMAIELNE
jgi:hypothetical protein